MRLRFLRRSQAERPGRAGWIGVSMIATVALALVPGLAVANASVAPAPSVHSFIPGVQALHGKSQSSYFPAPDQLKELNFLLGRYKCSTTPGGYTIYLTTSKILGGNYDRTNVTVVTTQGTVYGEWIFGWDSVHLQFTSYYFDDTGATGNASSLGWQNGQFNFTGTYVLVSVLGGTSGIGQGFNIQAADDFVIAGPGHVIDERSAVINGEWVNAGEYDCYRI